MSSQATSLNRLIESDLGVAETYRHASKRVAVGPHLELAGALLKWYEVHPAAQPVPPDITRLARDYLARTSLEARGLGFVVLHRCGHDFYFLIVCTWRNDNEIWQTVFYKDGETMPDFALVPRDKPHKPTLCVWELVPVWHEQQAWVRFLTSSRDEAAAKLWLNDLYTGEA